MAQYPGYLNAYRNGQLQKVAKQLLFALTSCCICPRSCRAGRLAGKTGFCKTARLPKIFSFMPHHGEEPPISGIRGSGTIFFSHCNLGCSYCQNYEFSQLGKGREYSCSELAKIMLNLQEQGCHNINLVTPTHVLPQIIESLIEAVALGLKIPLVYNTSGYELAETVKLLEGIVDIYLADSRYGDDAVAKELSGAGDYVEHNRAALKEMQRQVGVAKFDKNGIMRQGLIIRHLVLPNGLSHTQRIMEFIAAEISCDTYISLMSQYLPYHLASQHPQISRRLKAAEYAAAKRVLKRYGLLNGWIQESYGAERFAGVHIKPK